jgi:oleate hydratase
MAEADREEPAMRNYDKINALPPKGIEHKRAHIIGGGIAGLAAAAFLVDDAHMPAANVTIYEKLPIIGGSMDGAGDAEHGYVCRGERELEAWMECLWYLCGKVPSIQTPGRTILDETHEANDKEPIYSHHRLMHKQGQHYPATGPQMSRADVKALNRLLLMPESDLEGRTIAECFGPKFEKSVFWYCFSSMLAFSPWHSAIEFKRYVERFMIYAPGLTHLQGILHTEYNEFDSIIKPILVWLQALGVQFKTNTTIQDLQILDEAGETVVNGMTIRDEAGVREVSLTRDDLVFFTNGSMTQNASLADTHTVGSFDFIGDPGCFSVWQKLADHDPRFGDPATFIADVEKTNWISFFVTLKDGHRLFDHMEKKTRDKAPCGGGITVVDSAWKASFVLYGNHYYPDQPEGVDVLFAYGQRSDVPGDSIKKPMRDCTGAEMFAEMLYHCGLAPEDIDRTVAASYVSTAYMPYITSQFMPRKVADRPKVIPDGCVNLAFIGQYVELPGDVVFTVETSVRTAMMAVWGLTGLDKPIVPMYEPQYDLRVIMANLKAALGIEEIGFRSLPALMAGGPSLRELGRMLKNIPPFEL